MRTDQCDLLAYAAVSGAEILALCEWALRISPLSWYDTDQLIGAIHGR
jgi:hypothetical protein